MLWKGWIAVFLSFVTYSCAQTVPTSEISDVASTCGRRVFQFLYRWCTSEPEECETGSGKLVAIDPLNVTQNGTNEIGYGLSAECWRKRAVMEQYLIIKYFSYLGNKDLKQALNICKVWRELAIKELAKRRTETKIVNLQRKLRSEDYEILKNFEVESRKKRHWHPKLLLLFQIQYHRPIKTEWHSLLQQLSTADAKCLVVKSTCWMRDLTLRYGSLASCLTSRSTEAATINGCILPEALFKNFAADVIFPPLYLFQEGDLLFRGQPETNKRMFEIHFGWNADIPIKVAFIFSQNTFDAEILNYNPWTNGSQAELRAQQVSRWLKSLPEGGQMLVFSLPEYTQPHEAATGNDKDISVLLLGGDAIVVDSFFMQYRYPYRVAYRKPRTATKTEMEEKERELSQWKIDVIDKWPETSQRIAFLIADPYYAETVNIFRRIFGDSIQLVVLRVPTHTLLGRMYKATFLIIGFPES